ncbi:histidinol-phosphate transaminase [Pseudogracilibacillus sp. SE30717A]|uniref:histidinol-phosphate transaminase n=1 Tax=Pseudogracilibacillus sp. SE30717A TaxID=3098293 RepID=UPI00300E6552
MVGKEILNQMSAYKQGMQISEVQKKYDIEKIVKLASNENPYGFSNKVKEELDIHFKDYEFYPDGYSYELRTKLAEKLHIEEDQLVFGSGSDEIITFICRAFLYPGTNTVMAGPTFPQYRHHSLIEGAEIREIPTLNGRHDLLSMAAAINSSTKVVWLCSPDNPTGELISKDDFNLFMNKCPNDVIVVLDEAYYEFVSYEDRLSLNENLLKYPNLIVLRTFSKIYGLAGLRVGYGVASEELAEKLNIVRGPFNTTSYSQFAALTALNDDEFIEKTRKLNNKVKQEFQHFLDSIQWKYNESHTNFLLVKTPVDADKTAFYLLKNGFIVRSGNLLGYPNTVRITIGNEDDMKDLQIVIYNLHTEINDGVIK